MNSKVSDRGALVALRLWCQRLGAIGMFVVVWSAAAKWGDLPHLPQVLRAIVGMIEDGTYFHDISISLVRFLAGWVLGATLAIPLGLLTGRERLLLGPMLELNLHGQRAVPVIALVPLAVYWWGIGEAAKVFLVTWGVFFPVWVSTHNGVLSLNANYINAARCLGTRGLALWWRVVLPHTSEPILSGLRVAIGVGLICVVAAELTGTLEKGFFSQGLGYRIQRSADINQLDRLLGCILTFGLLGWGADRIFRQYARRTILFLAGFDPNRSVLRVGSTPQS